MLSEGQDDPIREGGKNMRNEDIKTQGIIEHKTLTNHKVSPEVLEVVEE